MKSTLSALATYRSENEPLLSPCRCPLADVVTAGRATIPSHWSCLGYLNPDERETVTKAYHTSTYADSAVYSYKESSALGLLVDYYAEMGTRQSRLTNKERRVFLISCDRLA